MKKPAPVLVLLLLIFHLTGVHASGRDGAISASEPITADSHSRAVSDEIPFGIDYGFHPFAYMSSSQGVPTHQLSMFHAQVLFAEDTCTMTPKPTRFQRGFHNLFLLAYDKDRDQPYKLGYTQAVEALRARYQGAWAAMTESQRSTFCENYWSDIRYFAETSVGARMRRVTTGIQFYLGALMPLSSETLDDLKRQAEDKEKRDKVLLPLLLLGQALALAGGASAGFDGLSAQKTGNYSLAQARMGVSRDLLNLTSSIGQAGIASATGGPQDAPSVPAAHFDCRALVHFDQYDAAPSADVWKTYQSLSTDCEAFSALLKQRYPTVPDAER